MEIPSTLIYHGVESFSQKEQNILQQYILQQKEAIQMIRVVERQAIWKLSLDSRQLEASSLGLY